MNEYKKIGIIGVGLIGGSIQKALKLFAPKIEIVTFPFPISDEVFLQKLEGLDLIFICTPLMRILDNAYRLKDVVKHPLVVVDVGSVKCEVIKVFEKLSQGHLEFVGSHPIAGKTSGGEDNSEADLFIHRPWVITPHANNKDETIQSVKKLIETTKAHSLILNPQVHDEYAALISHLPAILARKYVSFVEEIAPEALSMAGTGYESFTRLAHDSPILRQQIEHLNEEKINIFLKKWKEQL